MSLTFPISGAHGDDYRNCKKCGCLIRESNLTKRGSCRDRKFCASAIEEAADKRARARAAKEHHAIKEPTEPSRIDLGHPPDY